MSSISSPCAYPVVYCVFCVRSLLCFLFVCVNFFVQFLVLLCCLIDCNLIISSSQIYILSGSDNFEFEVRCPSRFNVLWLVTPCRIICATVPFYFRGRSLQAILLPSLLLLFVVPCSSLPRQHAVGPARPHRMGGIDFYEMMCS